VTGRINMTQPMIGLYRSVISYDGAWYGQVYLSDDYLATSTEVLMVPCNVSTRYVTLAADLLGNVVVGAYVGATIYTPAPSGLPKIFYSHNAGLGWSASDATFGQGVSYIATDYAGTWIAVTNGADTTISGIPRLNRAPAEIWRSTDVGETWTRVRQLSDGTHFGDNRGYRVWPGCIAVETDRAGTWCVTCGLDIYRSTDNGLTWSIAKSLALAEYGDGFDSIDTDGNGVWLATTPYGYLVYPADPSTEVWRSTDNGATWSMAYKFPVKGDWADWLFGKVCTNRDGVWLTGAYYYYLEDSTPSVYKSEDNGTTWTGIADIVYDYGSETENIVFKGDTFFCAENYNTFLSLDAGDTWTTPVGSHYWSNMVFTVAAVLCPPGVIYSSPSVDLV